jgi:D-beta-D-heptose 7-phosphate kinase/D-beta-D-heptose 1-phosphate adenosyltransferase
MLREEAIDDTGVLTIGDRPTTRKTRIVAHNQQVVRADWEHAAALGAADRARVVAHVAQRAAQNDAVILSDYGKGLLSRDIVEAAMAAPLVLADPKPQNVGLFTGVTCVAPNVHEVSTATGVPVTDAASLERAGAKLLADLGCRYVVVTRGEAGMSLFGAQGERLDIPSVARKVYDVSGAGDTVIAVLALALAGAAPIERAMQLANFAAGAVVEKLGTATASSDEILALVEHGHH